MPKLDLTGQTFERLTVIKDSGERRYESVVWECLCECGNTHYVVTKSLRSGATRSCGCLRKEVLSSHGESRTRLYSIWGHILDRTQNPESTSYDNYGGRGILLCDDWFDFAKFSEWARVNGYTEETTIDRINVDGNYEPSNCRWTTPLQQANNRTNNHYLEYNGKTQSMADWAREYGLAYDTLRSRIRRGWTMERALNQKPQTKNKRSE